MTTLADLAANARAGGRVMTPTTEPDLPDRIVVGTNGAYWRDYGTHYSMCPVSADNDPIEPVAVYVRSFASAMTTPTTDEGRDMLDHSVQYHPADADRAVTGAKIAAIESAARHDALLALRTRLLGLRVARRVEIAGKVFVMGHRDGVNSALDVVLAIIDAALGGEQP